MTEKLELSKDGILKGLGNKTMPESAKEKLLTMLINLEAKEKVGKPGYDTLSS